MDLIILVVATAAIAIAVFVLVWGRGAQSEDWEADREAWRASIFDRRREEDEW